VEQLIIPPQLHIFFGDSASGQPEYESLYSFWQKEWTETFKELKDDTYKGYSDEFCKEDIKVALFSGARPVAFCGMSYYDLQAPSQRDLAYLRKYPSEVLDQWGKSNLRTALSLGHLCKDMSWDHPYKNRVAYLVVASCLKVFLESLADFAIAYTRNDRGVNKLCYSLGAKCEQDGLVAHNVEVDIVRWFKEPVSEKLQQFSPKIFPALWEKRMQHGIPLERKFNKQAA